MNRLSWELRRLVGNLGLAGGVGLLMLIVGLVVHLSMSRAAMDEIVAQKSELSKLRTTTQTHRRYRPEEDLTQFYDFFPTKDHLISQLRTVNDLADGYDIVPEHVDYKYTRLSGTPLWRYQINIPLVTDYVTLRLYVSDLLAQLPNAALEDIEMSRQDAGSDQLEIKLNLTLYFQDKK